MRVKARRGGMHKCLSGLISSLVNAYLFFLHYAFSPSFLKLLASEDANPHWLHLWKLGMQDVWTDKHPRECLPVSTAPHPPPPPPAFFLLSHHLTYISHYLGRWKIGSFQSSVVKKQLITKFLIALLFKQVQWIPQLATVQTYRIYDD